MNISKDLFDFDGIKNGSVFGSLRLGLCAACGVGMALGGGSAFAENYADELLLRNCGDYNIAEVTLQGKWKGSGWYDTRIEYSADLEKGEGVCFDLTRARFQGIDSAPTEYRLKVKIRSGDTVTCDGTNYKSLAFTRRRLTMKGTTANNNGCKSVRYNHLPSGGAKCIDPDGNPYVKVNAKC